jgi:hypothetical protein
MIQKKMRPACDSTRGGPREGFSVKSNSPKNRLKSALGQTPRYIRWPVKNDDGHVVGHELLRLSPALQAYIGKMAMEGRS